jgi:hypothetical protein
MEGISARKDCVLYDGFWEVFQAVHFCHITPGVQVFQNDTYLNGSDHKAAEVANSFRKECATVNLHVNVD